MARFPLNEPYVISQGYGMTAYAKTGAYGGGPHTGIDIAVPCGRTTYWPVPVVKVYRGWEPNGYGNFAVGTTAKGDEIWFGHFSRFGSGGIAGYIGSSGMSTGCHTHFEVRRGGKHINPQAWLNEQGKESTDMYNGDTAQNWYLRWLKGLRYDITGNTRITYDDLRKHHLGYKTEKQVADKFIGTSEWKAGVNKAYRDFYGRNASASEIAQKSRAKVYVSKLREELAKSLVK